MKKTDARVFVGSLATETNTFSPLRTDLQDFKDSFFAPPGQHPETPTLCSAIFPVVRSCASQYRWNVTEGTATWAEPGGIINQRTWEFLRDQLLREVRDALPLDVILLGLHGAMVAQDCLDCEGELLEAVRKMAGPNAIIGVTFDPHSHLSQKRLDNVDLIVAFKEFPHTDFVTAAQKLTELAHQTMVGKITPTLSVFDCKMIEVLPTSKQPMRGFVDHIKNLEGIDSILSISAIHGFMAGDVPDLGTKMIVITDGAKEQGDRLAQKLGMELFELRGKTRPEFLSPFIALDKATESPKSPVVIADVWDNPGGGVPGDSTLILFEMVRRGLSNTALATIWDPMAVRTCISAGEGAVLPLRFGAKTSATAGNPMDAIVTVKKITLRAKQRFGASFVPMGDCVCIKVHGIDVVLNSVRSQVFSPDVFTELGISPENKKILVVKSTNHFHDAFEKISSEILYAAVDGPYPNDPVINEYRNLTREIWPRIDNPHGDLNLQKKAG